MKCFHRGRVNNWHFLKLDTLQRMTLGQNPSTEGIDAQKGKGSVEGIVSAKGIVPPEEIVSTEGIVLTEGIVSVW